jgi:hypothetical protein
MKIKYFFIILILLAIIFTAGCVGGNKETISTPSTSTTMPTSTPNSLSRTYTPEVTQPTYITMAGSVSGGASNPSGMDDIIFSIHNKGADVDLTKMKIVFTSPGRSPVTLTQGATASTSVFTTKTFRGIPVNLLNSANPVIDINFKLSPIPSKSQIKVEIIPDIGAPISFSKSVGSVFVTTDNMRISVV